MGNNILEEGGPTGEASGEGKVDEEGLESSATASVSTPRPPIRKIGCIHFDQDRIADPLSTIKAAIAKSGEVLSDALIVLPEALDVGKRYYCSGKADSVFDISELKALSCEFNVAFVAGLTEKSCFHQKPYNSAFLIDPERICRLSRKMHPDPNASWYQETHCGHARCIAYRGLIVTSLICQDAAEFKQQACREDIARLQKSVLKRLRSGSNRNSPVLCVPARMTTYKPSVIADSWPKDINVVVANVGNPDRCSGTRAASRGWESCLEGICLQPLPSGGSTTP